MSVSARRQARGRARALFAAAFLIAAAGCASAPRVSEACPEGDRFRRAVETVAVGAPDELQRELRSVMGRAPLDNRRDILVLSGGGQYGAYGAGLLDTFITEARAGRKFAVVTGVSTGALQATAAFLADPASLRKMAAGYEIERESDLARSQNTIFGFPARESFYSLEPTRAVFDDFLTDERLKAVAEAGRLGRKLYVGAVEVKDGKFYAFDLTAIAASDLEEPQKRACYTQAVFASAAVPVIYRPVVFGGRQYFDGGVRASVFLDEAAAALAALPRREAERATIYVLFNNYLTVPPPPENGTAFTAVAALNRTRQIAFDQIDRASLAALRGFADRYDVRWTKIPSTLCSDARTETSRGAVFDPPFMRCLIAAGRADGVKPGLFKPLQ